MSPGQHQSSQSQDRQPSHKIQDMRVACALLLLACLPSAQSFVLSTPSVARRNIHGVTPSTTRTSAGAASLRMAIPKSTAPAKLIEAGSDEAMRLEKELEQATLWSVPPTMMTMHLDNPEKFVIVRGKVEIMPVTIQGKPLGDAVEFKTGDYGIVPGGSYRWQVLKQTTKKSKLDANEPIGLLGTKGWREEPPIKALQGLGTMSTQGLDAEDNLEYLKDLVRDKGFIPKGSWESAIQYKLDRDIYLANLSFVVTEEGIIVKDRVSDKPLAVLTENAWEEYDESKTYTETESSRRWRKDGTFQASIMMRNKSVSESSGV